MQFTLRERHPRPISAGPRLVSAAVWLNSDTLRAKNSEVHLIIEWVEQVGGTCADINIAEIVRVKLPFSPLSSPRLSFRTSRFDLETFPRCITMAWLSFPVVVHRKGSFFALTCLFACLLIATWKFSGDLLIKYQYRFSSIEMRSRGIIWILFVLNDRNMCRGVKCVWRNFIRNGGNDYFEKWILEQIEKV